MKQYGTGGRHSGVTASRIYSAVEYPYAAGQQGHDESADRGRQRSRPCRQSDVRATRHTRLPSRIHAARLRSETTGRHVAAGIAIVPYRPRVYAGVPQLLHRLAETWRPMYAISVMGQPKGAFRDHDVAGRVPWRCPMVQLYPNSERLLKRVTRPLALRATCVHDACNPVHHAWRPRPYTPRRVAHLHAG
jgi:hypothetical protein